MQQRHNKQFLYIHQKEELPWVGIEPNTLLSWLNVLPIQLPGHLSWKGIESS
jgi:hypothetical protein